MAIERIKISEPSVATLCAAVGWSKYYAVGWIQTWREGIANGTYPARGTPMQMAMGMPSYEPSDVMIVRHLVDAGLLLDDGGTLVAAGCDALLRKRRARQAAGRLGGMSRAKKAKAKKTRATAKPKALAKKTSAALEPPKQVAAVSSQYWDLYASLYFAKYNCYPLRNATSNAQMVALLKRIGADNLTAFLTAYIGHKDFEWCRHTLGPALKQAESLYTQYITGQTDCRADIRSQASGDALVAQVQRIRRGELL